MVAKNNLVKKFIKLNSKWYELILNKFVRSNNSKNYQLNLLERVNSQKNLKVLMPHY